LTGLIAELQRFLFISHTVNISDVAEPGGLPRWSPMALWEQRLVEVSVFRALAQTVK
jgi:hypothetical protein